MTSLSPAMSTASAEVFDVIVARIRCWYLPHPSWTSDASFRRIHGMSRLAASSMMAWVEGPNARRSASRMSRSSSSRKSKSSSGETRWFTSRTASSPAATPDALLPVPVDHVVAAGVAGAARLAAVHVRAGLPLQLDRDVLGDVSRPRALAEALAEAAPAAERAGMLRDPGQHLEEAVDEAGDRVRGPVLERPEVDEEPDRRVVGPEVRAAEDLGLDDLQVGRERALVLYRLPLRAMPIRPRAGPALAHSEASRSSPGAPESSVLARRSNHAPSGKEWTIAPETMIGRCAFA